MKDYWIGVLLYPSGKRWTIRSKRESRDAAIQYARSFHARLLYLIHVIPKETT